MELTIMLITSWLLTLSLSVVSIEDVRKHRVWIGGAVPAALMHIGYKMTQGSWRAIGITVLGAVVCAICLWLVHYFTGGGIGSGDIWIMAGICLAQGPDNGAVVILMALAMAAAFSVFILICKCGNRHSRIPLVPFLAAASLIYSLSLVVNCKT